MFRINNSVVELVQGDISVQQVDAIVNAANSALAGGGGVDGAIHRRGGPSIMEETRSKYPTGCPTGTAVITGGGNLPVKYVIHTVGPVWRGGASGEPELLASAYRSSLQLAADHKLTSLAFPSLSTGAYGYPMDKAAAVALTTISDFLKRSETTLRLVLLVLFDAQALDVYQAAARQYAES